MSQEPFFTTLKNRGKITISGADRTSFLQNIITNDMNLLASQDSIYACLLTPQGKFLYDFFIHESAQGIIIDCEGNARMGDLAKLLNMYKLHADIDIKVIENIDVYAVIGSSKYGYKDPRHEDMGYRSYIKPDLPEQDFGHWDQLRISLCIPDGSRDMIVGKSTLLECNIDKLHGVSFDKGCYIGQEITARMHYRGLVKKHLRVVTSTNNLTSLRKQESFEGTEDPCLRREYIAVENFPAFDQPIIKNSKTIGEMRSSCGGVGLALIKY